MYVVDTMGTLERGDAPAPASANGDPWGIGEAVGAAIRRRLLGIGVAVVLAGVVVYVPFVVRRFSR